MSNRITNLNELEEAVGIGTVDRIMTEYLFLQKAKADMFDRIVAVMDSEIVNRDKLDSIKNIIDGDE